MTPSIALVILAKNQRSDVKEILASVGKAFNAVYVLDDNSTDGTSKLSGAKIYTRTLGTSFAEHRNWILARVQEEWTFFLDADERLSQELLDEIRLAIIKDERVMAFSVPRLDVYQERVLLHGEVGKISLVRLAQTQIGQGQWKRSVHEYWSFPEDKVVSLKKPLLHYAHKDITSFMAKLHLYASLEKRERKKRTTKRLCLEMFVYPLAKFIQNYFLRFGFLDGRAGFIYAFMMSYYSLIKRVFWYEDSIS